MHDVVRHVVQMNELIIGAAADERNERTRRFDPKTRPSAWLAVEPAPRTGAVAVDPLLLLGGLTGRVPLAEVVAAPDDVLVALGVSPEACDTPSFG